MRVALVVLLFVVLLNAEHVRWQGDFEKAREEAVAENKELMVLLISEQCVACMQMLTTTFLDQPYIAYLNQNYVAVLVRKGQRHSYPIELLYTLEYPTLFFLDQEESYTKEALHGYISPKALQVHLDN